MTPMDWITGGLILMGSAVMLLSVLGTARVLHMVRASKFLRRWQILRLLMIFFLVGYLAAIGFLLAGLKDLLAVITGAVFFFGALFVYLVVRVGRATIEDLRDRAQRLQAQQEELQAVHADEVRLREQVLATQRTAAALSTPVIPIAAGILAMPLIGTVDEERTQQITRALLNEVYRHRATEVIIDITGVSRMDDTVVRALLKTAEGVRLLGAEPILTGVRAEVAQVMIGAGLNLATLAVRATLEEGLTYALASRTRPQGKGDPGPGDSPPA